MEQLHVNLLAGVFVNFACATNFFVYFVTSKEYRQVFNEHIFFCARSSKTGGRLQIAQQRCVRLDQR
ncbi:hypothetical protein OESDEN_24860 [Oesophagostomum dentatum]|uniref:Uncharacterized protein n=1 Tax=Oesophagostomum dentatum TaxID=61180 RepID=A0A0B1RSA7_OESDE|nr:hypothetical protein OESDEN_24860 [Oesophagostomum dentatum]